MLRPFLVLLLGLATVSSTITQWTKIGEVATMACPMPDEGEEIHGCSWKNGIDGKFKSNFKKTHGDRISIEKIENDTLSLCKILFDTVEEEDEGTWGCRIGYENKDGETIYLEAERILNVANTTEATNYTSKNLISGSVEKDEFVDVVCGTLYFLVSIFLGTYEKMRIPEFAYSLALSPSAAAGVSKTGELGVAIGSNGDVMVFGSHCLGVKADVSLEFDLVLGMWTSVSDIPGRNFAIGAGVDNVNFRNEFGTEESGGNFKILFNSQRVIGGTLSVGRGFGYDLPIDSEVTFDICHTEAIIRLNWREIFSRIKQW